MHGRFIWYELMTTDTRAAKTFYTEVVGWGVRDASMPGIAYELFTAGTISIGGLIELPEEARKMGARPSWVGYVGVDDVDATADRVRKLGGAVHIAPKTIPNVSRFSVIADPQMATLALFKWLKPDQAQPAEPNILGGVGWHELIAADWEKAWPFYSELFGWQTVEADFGAIGAYQLFSAAGQTIGGMLTKHPTLTVPFWLYYFNVDDIDVAVRRVEAGGGRVVSGPLEVRNGRWITQCTDSQGAIFALVGKRSRDGIGYFKRAASRDPDARLR